MILCLQGVVRNIQYWYVGKVIQKQKSYIIIIAIYFVICITILFGSKGKGSDAESWSLAVGVARVLSLNCALILIPVCKSFIRWMFNKAFEDDTTLSFVLRKLNSYVPLATNLEFHILVARVVVFTAFLHTYVILSTKIMTRYSSYKLDLLISTKMLNS